MYNNFSLSLQLTFTRFLGALCVLPFFIVYVLPFNTVFANGFVSTVFLLLGITDFFDGYFARKYQQVTPIGATFDHLADKFLLYSTLIALVAIHKICFLWAIIWIGREFLVMGLRILALENSFSVHVSSFGKSKTVAQIFCLAFIIFNPYQAFGIQAVWWNGTELLLLIVTSILSLFSAYKYCVYFMKRKIF